MPFNMDQFLSTPVLKFNSDRAASDPAMIGNDQFSKSDPYRSALICIGDGSIMSLWVIALGVALINTLGAHKMTEGDRAFPELLKIYQPCKWTRTYRQTKLRQLHEHIRSSLQLSTFSNYEIASHKRGWGVTNVENPIASSNAIFLSLEKCRLSH